ncbi:MAG: (Fe-S)-binding protein [Bacillota bacterium]|nr:(Fe-S)-binding protein [Bacillota bacterium]
MGNDVLTIPESLQPGQVEAQADLWACWACGTCTAGCPTVNIATGTDPRRLIRMLQMGRWRELLGSPALWVCTMCGRCSAACPNGIDVGLLARTVRTCAVEEGVVPPTLQHVVDVSMESGNNMAVTEDEFLETLAWVEEDLRAELGDDSIRIPIDQKGARILYTFNPREPKFYPLTISAVVKILHAAGESWTVSSRHWDCTNYALYTGDDLSAGELARRLAQEADALGAQVVAFPECGHAYRAFRWGAPRWLGRRVPAASIIELVAGYIREGRLHLDSRRNPLPVTYHDPCNMARREGIVEEPRLALRNAVERFIEMEPRGVLNYCCGGGGGVRAVTPLAHDRLAKGEVKARQIQRTGARIVATSCHTCVDQLDELNRHYRLGVRVLNVCELVAEALLL